MEDDTSFIIIDSKVAPEVFIKTLEAKKILSTSKSATIQEACEQVGMSRSAYYKYKDSVFPFKQDRRGNTVIIGLNLQDKRGLLSNILNIIAKYGWNIRNLNVTQPINNLCNITITMDNEEGKLSEVLEELEQLDGVINIKIIARE